MESVVEMIIEIIKNNWLQILSLIIIVLLICVLKKVIDSSDKKINSICKDVERYSKYFYLYSSWLDARNKGKKISDYLVTSNIKSVAVYGMADIGYKVCKELAESKVIELRFIMDKIIPIDTAFAPAIKDWNNIPKVDAIIVTPIHVYGAIENELKQKTEAKIISLEDIIYNL